jgi:hypothetical protein
MPTESIAARRLWKMTLLIVEDDPGNPRNPALVTPKPGHVVLPA